MNKLPDPPAGQQDQVNAYFQSQVSFWRDIYTTDDVASRIYQHRHEIALDWIDGLALPPGSRVLEVGCGAGFMSIELARRGSRVDAIDSTEGMLEQARRHAEAAGVTLSLSIADVTALSFDDDAFDLVVALGVIPWLEQPELALQEMARVTKLGGHVIFSADNRMRLNALVDPLLNPLVVPVKRGIKFVLDRTGLRRLSSKDVGATLHSRRFINKAVSRAGLSRSKSKTLGFGPFTLFRRPILPQSPGFRLHTHLQSLADRNVFILRSTGAHYLVLAEKAEHLPATPVSAGERDSDAVTA